MSNCEIRDLDSAAKAIIGIVNTNEVFLKKDKAQKFEQLRPFIRIDNIAYCLDRFIESELDYITEGQRGMGRLSTAIPRLGAYYRNKFVEVSSSSYGNGAVQIPKLELYLLIQDIMLRTYLLAPFFGGTVDNEPVIVDAIELFEKWLPTIYATEITEPSASVMELIVGQVVSDLEEFLVAHKFEKKKFAIEKEYTVSAIIYRYAVAGYTLRLVETGQW